jgi:hypothetical protein
MREAIDYNALSWVVRELGEILRRLARLEQIVCRRGQP